MSAEEIICEYPELEREGPIRPADPAIVAKPLTESGSVFTFDLDFGDILAIARSEAPSVVIFRLRLTSPGALFPKSHKPTCGDEYGNFRFPG